MQIEIRIETVAINFRQSNWTSALWAAICLAAWLSANAGTFSTDFNSGGPAGTTVTGTALVDATGGAGDSGVLKLTTADNSQQGSFLIDDLDGGATVSGFTATFKLLIGGGNGADGFSFNFANDLTDVFGEEGSGTGLTVSFDTYDNGGGEAPAIDLKNGGTVVASVKGVGALLRQNKFMDVWLQINSDGTLNLTVDHQVIYTNFYGAFTATPGRFGLGARTGGLNDNHFVDDLSITTSTAPPTQPAHPLVLSATPTGGAINPDAVITIQVRDFATKINTNSVRLEFGGAVVSPGVTKAGDVTTIQYDPPGLLPSGSTNTFLLVYSDDGSPATSATNQWTFSVINYKNIVLPLPIYLENFENVPLGGIPAGWTATNATDSLNPGMDINDAKSDSYLDWLVIDRNQVFYNGDPANPTPVWEAGDPDGRATHIAPGQLENGKVLTADDLMVGKFLYAESDERGGNQVQVIFSSNYDLTAHSNIWVSYHSSYLQNQDAIAALEYSIDGGTNWLPVVYMLQCCIDGQDTEADVHRFPDGTVDAVTTLLTFVDPGAAYGLNYGAFIGAPITQALAPYIEGRVNDDYYESHRLEIYPLPMAAHQSKVKFRFLQAGTGSWYWGIDNFGIYSIPPITGAAPSLSLARSGNSVTLSWPQSVTGFNLESTDSLSTPSWTPVSGVVNNSLAVTIGAGNRFYRLIKP